MNSTNKYTFIALAIVAQIVALNAINLEAAVQNDYFVEQSARSIDTTPAYTTIGGNSKRSYPRRRSSSTNESCGICGWDLGCGSCGERERVVEYAD